MEESAMSLMEKVKQIPEFFSDFFGKDKVAEAPVKTVGLNIPAVNISEGKDQFFIDVAAPGLNKKDITLNTQNNVLYISTETNSENEEIGKNFARREFRYSCFERSFVLPDNVDAENISASYKNGVLQIIVKKITKPDKPVRRVKIG